MLHDVVIKLSPDAIEGLNTSPPSAM